MNLKHLMLELLERRKGKLRICMKLLEQRFKRDLLQTIRCRGIQHFATSFSIAMQSPKTIQNETKNASTKVIQILRNNLSGVFLALQMSYMMIKSPWMKLQVSSTAKKSVFIHDMTLFLQTKHSSRSANVTDCNLIHWTLIRFPSRRLQQLGNL